jgi:hypothetical protein
LRWFRGLEMDEMKMSVDFSPCGGVRGVAAGEKGLADEPMSRLGD